MDIIVTVILLIAASYNFTKAYLEMGKVEKGGKLYRGFSVGDLFFGFAFVLCAFLKVIEDL